ncbi:MAG TPA: methyltransferase domain-containing protein [Deinococcales bacterium]|nr:methyltransferase domain-containing protein [Deinococcales bacterium]
MTEENGTAFWERPEMVARMAERPADRRLVQLFAGDGVFGDVHSAWQPGPAPRLLDVGCAGGRNTVWAAQQGADVHALDASAAMVRETRKRLAAVSGTDAARTRVRQGRMRDLGRWPDGFFELVIALGVLQDAAGYGEWTETLAEMSRVLRPGGLCLVANFGPDSEPQGRPLEAVPGERFSFAGFGPGNRRLVLPDVQDLDAEFGRHGFTPALPTEKVRTDTEHGFRTTLNALYRKGPAPGAADNG